MTPAIHRGSPPPLCDLPTAPTDRPDEPLRQPEEGTP